MGCDEREADDSVIWAENIDSDCRLRPMELVTPAENPHNMADATLLAPLRLCVRHFFHAKTPSRKGYKNHGGRES